MSSIDDLFGPLAPARDGAEILAALTAAARERILVLDGAMGTQIQDLGLGEDHFRGDRFVGCACHQQGNNDLLILTQPQAIEDIHYAYAKAGADIVETNTFSSTRIAQADYGMEDMVYELNRDGARLARRALRSDPPTAPPRCRPTSTIPASAPSPSTICASPMASSCAG
jgi:5-methyltetrahydrofolate--homocysteine methyltransferase